MRNHDLGDELLQALWMRDHERRGPLEKIIAQNGDRVPSAFERLLGEGKVTLRGDTHHLTPRGTDIGRKLVRRHRLAERLFYDLLGFTDEASHKVGCGFEHFLEDDATDAVCTFLGHPPVCPHNSPIPEGACCQERRRLMMPLIVPLSELEVGRKGKVIFVRTDDHKATDRLFSLGVYPGQLVHLHQKLPSYLLQIDHTEIGLESAVAGAIFVRPVD